MARLAKFEFLEHMADIKFVARGATPEEVFVSSAHAVSEYISSGVRVKDYESLLYAFLDELFYLLDAEGFLVKRAEVHIKNMKANAVLYGDTAKNYEIQHVKAATYAEMYFKTTMNGWEAQVVLDV